MNWIKRLWGFTQLPKVTGTIPKCSSASYTVVNNPQNGFIHGERIPIFKQAVSDNQRLAFSESLDFARCLSWKLNQIYGSRTNSCQSKQFSFTVSRQFNHGIHTGPNLSRDFLVQLWVADWEMKEVREKRERKIVKHANNNEIGLSTKGLHERFFSGSSVTEDRHYESKQSVIEHIKPASPEEALIAPLLSRPNLLITRDIEWANLTLGFEQENRYAVVDVLNPHEPAGFIREESNIIVRQLLRSRRPFVASITDGYGNELFRVRRPFWWITSSIYVEVGGKEIGVVHRRWHLWRRIYDLYLGNEQFAVVENPGLWNWTFTLKGINGEVLAEIDRDWRGFGFEIFTDAGQYVIRFGNAAQSPMSGPAANVQELEVGRSLTLSERAITVALAVSLDNDHFSRHGGWGLPFIAVEE